MLPPRQPLRKLLTVCLIGVVFLATLIAATPHLHAQSRAEAAVPVSRDIRDEHSYRVTVLGVYAGTVRLSGEQRGNAYRAELALESRGAGAAIRRVRFLASSEGGIANGRYAPARYAEDADTGKRQSKSVIEYKRGVPTVVTYRSDKDHRLNVVDPATQGGTLDPVTSIYAILRDVPREAACTAAITTFDGRRRTTTRLSDPRPQGEGLVCRGEYRRVAGYSDSEMAERSRFPFTVIYVPAPGGMMRVDEVRVQTLYGNAVMKRR
ncbi:MAG: DUF3108 domain-containing protein [Paracoccaceae bacterium]|nr:MAG: DUF3108 domain-containing protein [Paracoccaceae bacterium]